MIVSSDQTNALLTDLNPTSLYEIGVFASTDVGIGSSSQIVIVDSKLIMRYNVKRLCCS